MDGACEEGARESLGGGGSLGLPRPLPAVAEAPRLRGRRTAGCGRGPMLAAGIAEPGVGARGGGQRRGQEAGGELRPVLGEGAAVVPHTRAAGASACPASGFLEELPSGSICHAPQFSCAQSPWWLVKVIFLNPLGTCRDGQEELCPVSVSVVRGPVFPRHGCWTAH